LFVESAVFGIDPDLPIHYETLWGYDDDG